MQPLHDSRSRDRQMPVPSPRCILNCQALSIHLPPLPEPRDHSSRNKYLTSPISASPKQVRFVSPPQDHLSDHHQYSDSPTSTQSLSNRQISAQPRGGHSINRRPQDLDRRVSTPKSNADVDSRRSLPLNNDLQHSREDSVNELSSVTQDSPEAQQLAAGPPGIARRAKAHVPSACVNCKRKHLACETKRPCNRCIQTGKEVSNPTVLRFTPNLTIFSQLASMFNTRNAVDQDSERKKAYVTLNSDVSMLKKKIIPPRMAYSRFPKSAAEDRKLTVS